jgi:hypothetical protein
MGASLQHHSSHVRASYCVRVHAQAGTWWCRRAWSDASDASDASLHMNASRARTCARAKGSYLFIRQKRQMSSRYGGLLPNRTAMGVQPVGAFICKIAKLKTKSPLRLPLGLAGGGVPRDRRDGGSTGRGSRAEIREIPETFFDVRKASVRDARCHHRPVGSAVAT